MSVHAYRTYMKYITLQYLALPQTTLYKLQYNTLHYISRCIHTFIHTYVHASIHTFIRVYNSPCRTLCMLKQRVQGPKQTHILDAVGGFGAEGLRLCGLRLMPQDLTCRCLWGYQCGDLQDDRMTTKKAHDERDRCGHHGVSLLYNTRLATQSCRS